jgi:hypothetical protein
LTDEKVRENRLRRMLQRRGLSLLKSKRRDPKAIDYGGYMIVDASTNALVAGDSNGLTPFSLTIDDVEGWLKD